MIKFVVVAKQIEWITTTFGWQWDEPRYGFSITCSPATNCYPYIVSWGEGPQEEFATLHEAQKWCQYMVDDWVRCNVTVVERSNDTCT